MPTLICSGVNRPDVLALLARERVAGMVNATVACQPALVEAYERYSEVPLYLDSGAFQGKMDLLTYRRIVERVGQRFTWVANLDVIGDPHQSDANYAQLVKMLPPGLREKVLWVYQGGCLCELAIRARELKRVGIGGLVRMMEEQGIDAVLAYVKKVGTVLAQVGAQGHTFGEGSPSVLQAICAEPWFGSTDTSKWLIGYRAQELLLANGEHRSATVLGLRLSRSECAANNIRVLREWVDPTRQSQTMLSIWEELITKGEAWGVSCEQGVEEQVSPMMREGEDVHLL